MAVKEPCRFVIGTDKVQNRKEIWDRIRKRHYGKRTKRKERTTQGLQELLQTGLRDGRERIKVVKERNKGGRIKNRDIVEEVRKEMKK